MRRGVRACVAIAAFVELASHRRRRIPRGRRSSNLWQEDLTMAIMERWIQKMTSEKAWSIQIESEKKWAAVEKEIGGFPTKRLYRPLAARDDSTNFIFEREWGSLAEAEAAYERLFQSPQAQSLGEEIKAQTREEGIEDLVESRNIEYYTVID